MGMTHTRDMTPRPCNGEKDCWRISARLWSHVPRHYKVVEREFMKSSKSSTVLREKILVNMKRSIQSHAHPRWWVTPLNPRGSSEEPPVRPPFATKKIRSPNQQRQRPLHPNPQCRRLTCLELCICMLAIMGGGKVANKSEITYRAERLLSALSESSDLC